MSLRRIIIYTLFAVVPASLLAVYVLGNSSSGDGYGTAIIALGIIFLVSLLGLVAWSIAFLPVEPKLARIALVLHLILLILGLIVMTVGV